MKFLQLSVCQMTIHRRRSLRGRRWAYRLIGDDGLSLCSRGHLYGRSSRRAGPAKPTVFSRTFVFGGQAVAIRACLWREVVPRQRGKGLTRSRV